MTVVTVVECEARLTKLDLPLYNAIISPMKKDLTTKEAIKTIAEDIAIYILKLNIANVEFIDKEFERSLTRL